MKVIVVKKDKKILGKITPHKKSIMIGRSPICDLVIRKENVKPLHFMIEWTGEGSFDPYSGFWTIVDISNHDSAISGKHYSGEAQILSDEEVECEGYNFKFEEEKLAESAISKGVISRSLDLESSMDTQQNSGADKVLELVTYSRSNDVVTAINHFGRDMLSRGIKISSFPKLSFKYLAQNPNSLAVESHDEPNLTDIYNRNEHIFERSDNNFFKGEISNDDFYQLYSKESAYYLRWVPKVQVQTPPRSWRKDPVVLTLLFVTVAMFIIGMLLKNIERPVVMEIPKPARVATVEILDIKPTEITPPPLPVYDQDFKKEELIEEPEVSEEKIIKENTPTENVDKSKIKAKEQKEANLVKQKKSKELGTRATIKNVDKNPDLSQGLNQNSKITNVNTVGLLGKLGGAKKAGTGISADAVLSRVKASDSATSSAGKISVTQPALGKINLTGGGKTEANDDDGKGLAAASTTLKMDSVAKGSRIAGLASSKATGSIGKGAFGGNQQSDSDKIGTASGPLSLETKAMEVQGGLTKEQVRQSILDNKRSLRNCHEQYLTFKKDLGGRLVLKWKINGDGPVDTVNIQGSTTNHGPFDNCIVDIIKKIVFPKAPNGNSTIVIYPFVFQPKK